MSVCLGLRATLFTEHERNCVLKWKKRSCAQVLRACEPACGRPGHFCISTFLHVEKFYCRVSASVAQLAEHKNNQSVLRSLHLLNYLEITSGVFLQQCDLNLFIYFIYFLYLFHFFRNH